MSNVSEAESLCNNNDGVVPERAERRKKTIEELRLYNKAIAQKLYYKNHEVILERRRLQRLAKKGVDITVDKGLSLQERKKKKMIELGLLPPEDEPSV
jgi:hypothetical protein